MKVSTSRVRVAAPPEVVWAVLTEPRHVKVWQYGSDLETDWTVGSPIRFSSPWQGQVFEQWGTVLSFDPPWRLSYSLFAPGPGLTDTPENHFTMVYELVPDAGGTVLAIIQQDQRVTADIAETDDDSPVLEALKELAESL